MKEQGCRLYIDRLLDDAPRGQAIVTELPDEYHVQLTGLKVTPNNQCPKFLDALMSSGNFVKAYGSEHRIASEYLRQEEGNGGITKIKFYTEGTRKKPILLMNIEGNKRYVDAYLTLSGIAREGFLNKEDELSKKIEASIEMMNHG